ncbi:4'-phosphopantetheinyl transferase superfamily protein [Streptomyces sp. NPDC058469]|uniref:4'-phosphopantetheinyl transferase superfamily protein n=1 Tax=Streptomyces sp. NPDC058469 TaxID=3346514 RepID=UPI00365B1C73
MRWTRSGRSGKRHRSDVHGHRRRAARSLTPGRSAAYRVACAKESLYKAWFPLAHCWLDFLDVKVTLESTGQFEARLLIPAPSSFPVSTTGRRQVADAFITTALSVSARHDTRLLTRLMGGGGERQ